MTRQATCFMQMTFEWLPPALNALFTASSPSVPTPPSLAGPPQARFLLISFICLTDCHMWTCFSLVRKALISSCLFSSLLVFFFVLFCHARSFLFSFHSFSACLLYFPPLLHSIIYPLNLCFSLPLKDVDHDSRHYCCEISITNLVLHHVSISQKTSNLHHISATLKNTWLYFQFLPLSFYPFSP